MAPFVSIVSGIASDVSAIQGRDPAARGPVDALLFYPGMHAVWAYRVSNAVWRSGAKPLARAVSHAARMATGVEIHPGASIGSGLFIDHGDGVVIGETAEVGRDCTIYHGVTLGGTSLAPGKRHPTLGDGVVVGAGAKILGPIDVGDRARVGANAVVVRDVPAGAAVVGVPGQVVAQSPEPRSKGAEKAGAQEQQPDLIGVAVAQLLDRMDQIEQQVTGAVVGGPWRHRADGVWVEEDDFSI